jgi:hypothetical protein
MSLFGGKKYNYLVNNNMCTDAYEVIVVGETHGDEAIFALLQGLVEGKAARYGIDCILCEDARYHEHFGGIVKPVMPRHHIDAMRRLEEQSKMFARNFGYFLTRGSRLMVENTCQQLRALGHSSRGLLVVGDFHVRDYTQSGFTVDPSSQSKTGVVTLLQEQGVRVTVATDAHALCTCRDDICTVTQCIREDILSRDDTCIACGVRSHSPLSRCSRCRSVRYCDGDCQRAHWKTHRRGCKIKTVLG